MYRVVSVDATRSHAKLGIIHIRTFATMVSTDVSCSFTLCGLIPFYSGTAYMFLKNPLGLALFISFWSLKFHVAYKLSRIPCPVCTNPSFASTVQGIFYFHIKCLL